MQNFFQIEWIIESVSLISRVNQAELDIGIHFLEKMWENKNSTINSLDLGQQNVLQSYWARLWVLVFCGVMGKFYV